ncbi:MAG: NAD-dependent epimerase/dehydratase family protein [Merismopedia sp. SIO2A8]|nr:NAD-dependent epimerase/dehydratase family protein [Symploca sp. SIO2B6]NET50464.1 NAD-dependent epimerase/dehydratase family protein [Merismopedia sp. SIO2A8]
MADLTHNTAAPVLVTGATGYVAGWLVKGLLDEGLTVYAAVRDPSNTKKLQYLDAIAQQSPGHIKYFKADLLAQGSYSEAMEGCEVVFHTASPFTVSVDNPQKDLIDPAKLGTRNVLEQANHIESVKRVVVTSSCAAIYGDNADLAQVAGGKFTEANWNTTSSLKHQPYSYSKTLAEQEAWTIADAQDRWDLITINPSLVIGPGINPFATSESFSLIKQFGDGTMKLGVADYGIGLVDVRDVAKAHIVAGFQPSVQGRYIISGYNSSFPEIADMLRTHFGDAYPFPKKTLPKAFVWLVAPLFDKNITRKVVARNIGLPFVADNSKGLRELGMNYRPLATSLTEMFQQLVNHGLVAP